MKWHLGQIDELIAGSDEFVRVAIFVTSAGLVKCAVTQLVPYPLSVSLHSNGGRHVRDV